MLCFKIFGTREFNATILGLVFMILFSGFFTLSNLEKLLLDSTHKDHPDFTGDGFISLSILYIVFAISIWVVPSLLTVVGPKVILIIGTLGYSAFTASFYAESAWVLYFGSFCNGLGAALLWTGQGHYMVLNSTPETIQKHSAIFSVLSQSSMLYGNMIVFYIFQNKSHIDATIRTLVITILLGFSLSAFLLALLLPPPLQNEDDTKTQEKLVSPIKALKKALKLVQDKNMILLILAFIHMGLVITFISGVYGPCIGFTLQLKNSKELVPLCGFFAGVGEIIVCICLVTASTRLSQWRYGGCLVMLTVFVFQLTSLCLILLNIPNSALQGDTMDLSFMKPSAPIVLLCSALLGAGDGIYLIMSLTIIGKLYPQDSAQAVPIYVFFLSLACAVSFFYSMYISLHIQIMILMCTATMGTLAYSYVSKSYYENMS